MPTIKKKPPDRHLRIMDIRAIAELTTKAAVGVTHIVEDIHHAVLKTLRVSTSRTKHTNGLTGMIYSAIYQSIGGVGKTIDIALEHSVPLLEKNHSEPSENSAQRETAMAILNGIMGDRLTHEGSPFATTMTIRYRDQSSSFATMPLAKQPTGKILLMVHGLCMHDLHWHHSDGHSHVTELTDKLGYTPAYLLYNSGLHISTNGQSLAIQLESLCNEWPVPVQEITIIGHSMGGLVTRSAVYYAQNNQLKWPAALKNIIFLGTPHHGAPLEQAGSWVDRLLGVSRFSLPFARLGHLRSAGITDLRFGFIHDTDWLKHNRFSHHLKQKVVTPLPESVNCYTVAAITGTKSDAARQFIGDNLVPVNSALGKHKDPSRCLDFAQNHQWLSDNTNHMELLTKPSISNRLVEWLS